MAGNGNAYRDYRLAGVRRFLQTAVVIDNEADLDAEAPAPTEEMPKVAIRRTGSVMARAAEADAVLDAPAAAAVEVVDIKETPVPAPAAGAIPAEQEPLVAEAPGRLDAKALTDAFSERAIICGLYRPRPTEDMVTLATSAAKHSDVVIVDWFLENKSSVRAVQIVSQILTEDLLENGRLRLIAVYSSLGGVSAIASDLFEQLEEVHALKGLFTLQGATITGQNVRICVLNKLQAIGDTDVDKVSEGDMPERLLQEFMHLSTGLLTSFALHSIAAVRRAAHHIIAVFGERLDGAYLAHRSALMDPDEATDFAINLLVGELQNAIAVDERADGQIASAVLTGWVDEKASNHKFMRAGEEASADLVKAFVVGGLVDLKKATGNLVKSDGKLSEKSIKPQDVGELFYQGPQEAWERQLEFARLSVFKREAHGRSRLPSEWLPSLTLGSVLKLVGPNNDADKPKYEDLDANYFVCLQPVCDCVRIGQATGFPFQTGDLATTQFNLVVRERDVSPGTPLLMNSKLGQTQVLKFEPDADSGTVRAKKVGEEFIFTDARGREFIWLGDIRDLKAQHDVTAIAANAQRVGLVELEWFRLATESKVVVYTPPVA